VVTVAFLVIDLWSKAWAVRTLPVFEPDPARHLLGLITFRRSFNSGALFGLGEGMSSLFIAASVLALVFVLYLFACSGGRQRVMHVALGLILAGALGNLYDRAYCTAHLVTFAGSTPNGPPVGTMEVIGPLNADPVRMRHWGTDEEPFERPQDEIASIVTQSVVRDFIRFEPAFRGRPIWPWVFNIADVALTVGVIILLVQFCFDRKKARVAAGASPRSSPEDARV
jgi:lipoprotein signal peptidase